MAQWDGQACCLSIAKEKPLSTRVIIVRHGESTFNVQERVQGHSDASALTERGRWMAAQVALALRGIPIRKIYTSPLKRAKETAEVIHAQLQNPELKPPHALDLLKEIALLAWEDLPFAEVKAQFPEDYRRWQEAPETLMMKITTETGQTKEFFPLLDLYDRAGMVLETLLAAHANETIVIVGHSGMNRALICTGLGLGVKGYLRLQQANGGISVLNFSNGLRQPAQLEALNLTSHLNDPFPQPRFKEQTLRVFLVRHGETDWNRAGRFQGQIDVPLNENGRAQAAAVAEFLKNVPLHHALSSPLLRPKDTALAILQYHPNVQLELEPALAEISHGDWEGKFEPEVAAAYPGELERWRTTPALVQMPNGENLEQVRDRVVRAWELWLKRWQTNAPTPHNVLVVAHDATNKVLLCHIVGLGIENFWLFKQGNGSVTVIDYPLKGGLPRLQAVNITTHLGGVLDQTAAGAL
ncbi:MAG: phosphoglycerate mutase [Thermosynechococcus sp.]|uniref:histidine phosphatase family protein n=1 Tax=Thermosynechococcus sp. TaxID=2814275 RepID=UPI00220D5787|nr:histidine phosphatase family protein [Thermosynechococcus sp.]BCX13227.1 MAG: phosphoglycerate mutase [Thermosynechococcus sp.]